MKARVTPFWNDLELLYTEMRRKKCRKLIIIITCLILFYVIINITLMRDATAAGRRCPELDWILESDADENSDFDTSDVAVNWTWVAERKKLSLKAAAAAKTAVDDEAMPTARVLIIGYMRGGSTLFGELFNRHYNHLLWYEPLDSFYMARYGFDVYSNPLSLLYNHHHTGGHTGTGDQHGAHGVDQQDKQQHKNFTRRPKSAAEIGALTDFLHSLLTCNVKRIPVETFAHPFLYQSSFLRPVYHCLENFEVISRLMSCKRRSHINERCSGGRDPSQRHVDVAERLRCAEAIAFFQSERPSAFNEAAAALLQVILPGLELFTDTEQQPSSDGRNTTSALTTITSATVRTTTKTVLPAQAFFDHFRCIDELRTDVESSCISSAESMCPSARLIAAEVVRAAIDDLESLIVRMPDIHIIHYVRDPRAISVSRTVNTRLTFATDGTKMPHEKNTSPVSAAEDLIVAESRALCDRMLADIRARKRLEIRYPGAVSVVKYEDLVANPNRTVADVFSQVVSPGDDVSLEAVNRWLHSVMYSKVDSDAFSIQRNNAKMTASRWTTHINYKQGRMMNRICRRVLLELGYKL